MDANPDFTSVTTDDIEQSLTSLSANINAATFEQLMLIAEFDSRHGWGHLGVRSCAHWLNWRCGISTTTACHSHAKRLRLASSAIPKRVLLRASAQLITKSICCLLRAMAPPAT